MKFIRDFSEKNQIIDFFNPQHTPKTQEQINLFSSEIIKSNEKKTKVANVIFISTLIILFALLSILVLTTKESFINNKGFMVAHLLSLLFVFVFIIYQTSRTSSLSLDRFFIKLYTGKISDSYNISERNGAILTISTMLYNETLRNYLEAVSAQGRELAEAEFEVLFDFYTKTEEYLQEQKLAKELLMFNNDVNGEEKHEG